MKTWSWSANSIYWWQRLITFGVGRIRVNYLSASVNLSLLPSLLNVIKSKHLWWYTYWWSIFLLWMKYFIAVQLTFSSINSEGILLNAWTAVKPSIELLSLLDIVSNIFSLKYGSPVLPIERMYNKWHFSSGHLEYKSRIDFWYSFTIWNIIQKHYWNG